MNSKSTVFLLLAVLIFGAYIYFIEQKMPTTDENLAVKNHVLKLNAGKVTHIGLTLGNDSIAFEKKDGSWVISKPIAAGAESGQLEVILAEIESLTKIRELDPEPIFGLQSPTARLSLVGDNREDVLIFGNKAKLSDNVYLQVNDSPKVCLVKKSLFDKLNKKLDEFRDKRLFTIDENEVKNVSLVYNAVNMKADTANNDSQSINYQFLATETYGWDMLAPIKVAADSDAVSELLRKLMGTKIVEFVGEVTDKLKLAQYGLENPIGEIELKTDDLSEKVLIGYKIGGNIYLKKENYEEVFIVLFQPLADYFFKDAFFYRNKKVCSFYDFEVAQIHINDNGRQLFLQKEQKENESVWSIVKEGKKSLADAAKVGDFLKAVKNIKIEKFVSDNVSKEDLAAKGLLESISTLELITDKKETLFLSFGKVEGDYVYVTLADQSIYQLRKEVELIVRFAEGFFDKEKVEKIEEKIDNDKKE